MTMRCVRGLSKPRCTMVTTNPVATSEQAELTASRLVSLHSACVDDIISIVGWMFTSMVEKSTAQWLERPTTDQKV